MLNLLQGFYILKEKLNTLSKKSGQLIVTDKEELFADIDEFTRIKLGYSRDEINNKFIKNELEHENIKKMIDEIPISQDGSGGLSIFHMFVDDNGNLIIQTDNSTSPNISINEDGYLIYTFKAGD